MVLHILGQGQREAARKIRMGLGWFGVCWGRANAKSRALSGRVIGELKKSGGLLMRRAAPVAKKGWKATARWERRLN